MLFILFWKSYFCLINFENDDSGYVFAVSVSLCVYSAGRISDEQDYYSGYTHENFRTDKRYSEMLDLSRSGFATDCRQYCFFLQMR